MQTPALALALVVACGQRAEPPSPDRPQATAPSLASLAVLVLPAQAGPMPPAFATDSAPAAIIAPGAEPVPGLDAELAFALTELGRRTRWVLPDAMANAIARSPSLRDIRLHGLAVSAFHRAEVENIGDPLFGDLRRLSALMDARYALVPVAALYAPDGQGSGRVEIAAALIDTLGGRVVWFGAVAGEPGAQGSAAVIATAAQALARQVAR